ncbi:hypothetical protein HQ529_00050 [Candidatus Woesearchaeota archaeon]|nr:hypothetical protein [Candidatus Woesearchaeota archaeon]
MALKYKQKCIRCKKNYVLATSRQNYVICYECQENELKGNIKDEKMKKFFNIPHKYYKENAFLRNIKINYLKYHSLSEKQIEAFKKTVKQMREDARENK